MDWVSGCLSHHKCLFGEYECKAVLLTWLGNAADVFNKEKSSRADGECRFSHFGEAKNKRPAGRKRMVKATLKAM